MFNILGNFKIQGTVVLLVMITMLTGCVHLSANSDNGNPPPPKNGNYDEKVPVGEELTGFLKQNNILTLTLINSLGELRIVDQLGNAVQPCARLDGTKIVPINDACVFEGHLTHINSIEIIVIEGREDPVCHAGAVFWPC